jgi:hypothetical protein
MKRIVSLFALALVTALFSLNALAQNANPYHRRSEEQERPDGQQQRPPDFRTPW